MMIKKIGALLLAFLVFVAIPVTVSAAPALSPEAQAIIDELSKGIVMDGKTVYIPAEYINQAKTYLSQNDVTISEADSQKIIGKVAEARKVATESGYSSLNELMTKGSSLTQEVVNIAKEAAKTVGLTLTFNSTSKNIKIADADGNIVFEATPKVKQTGVDAFGIAGVSAAAILVGLLAACAITAKKKELFA